MRKEKRFSLTIHLLSAPVEISQFGTTQFVLNVAGVAQFYPEDEFEKITYDIDEVTHEGINVLPFLKVLINDVKDIEDIDRAVMTHLYGVFYNGEKSQSIFKAYAS